MSKATEIKLVGQPILGQVLGLIDKWDFKRLVKKKNQIIITRRLKDGII